MLALAGVWIGHCCLDCTHKNAWQILWNCLYSLFL